jgi:hypothetical protein
MWGFRGDSDSGLSLSPMLLESVNRLSTIQRFGDDVLSLGDQRLTTEYSRLSGARSKPRSSRVQDTLGSGSWQVGSVRYVLQFQILPAGPGVFL